MLHSATSLRVPKCVATALCMILHTACGQGSSGQSPLGSCGSENFLPPNNYYSRCVAMVRGASISQDCCTQTDMAIFFSGSHGNPKCYQEQTTNACNAGFYFSSVLNATQTCPAGFFCPRGLLCMLPCSQGAYCPYVNPRPAPAPSNPLGAACSNGALPYRFLPGAPLPPGISPQFAFLCPGAATNDPCPQATYCPNVTTSIGCPSGYFCPAGLTSPKACSAMSLCPAGTASPKISYFSVCILVWLLLLFLALFWQRHSRSIKKLLLRRYPTLKSQSLLVTARFFDEDDDDDSHEAHGARLAHSRPDGARLALRVDRGSASDDIVEDEDTGYAAGGPEESRANLLGGRLGVRPVHLSSSFTNLADESMTESDMSASTLLSALDGTAGTYHSPQPSPTPSRRSGPGAGPQCPPLHGTESMSLGFKNLSFAGSDGHKLLHNVNGTIKAGRVTAIMGLSGCGKTSFLNVLCGKAVHGKVAGTILINGYRIPEAELSSPLQHYKTVTGFVPQKDIMHATLTVSEVLWYQICLRCPVTWTAQTLAAVKRKERLYQVLTDLQLYDAKDKKIGNEENKVLSGGQQKRVNIGMELVADPLMLFLDEPTSGLDSAYSLSVIELLARLARPSTTRGPGGKLRLRTIVLVIHQPRQEMFQKIHDVFFFGRSTRRAGGRGRDPVKGPGRLLYAGPTCEVLPYFRDKLFYECPTDAASTNAADFAIDILSGHGHLQRDHEHRVVANDHDAYLIAAWEALEQERERVAVEQNTLEEPLGMVVPGDYPPQPLHSQFFTYFKRCMVVFYLHSEAAWIVLIDLMYIIIGAFALGLVEINMDLASVCSTETLSSIVIGLTTMVSSLRVFEAYRVVYWREAQAGVNRLAYFLAANVAHMFWIVLSPVVYLGILYPLLNPRSTFQDHYGIVFLAVWATSGLAYWFSNMIGPKNSQIASVVFVLVSSMLAGSSPTLVKLGQIPLFMGEIAAATSYSRWLVEGIADKECQAYPEIFDSYALALRTITGYTTESQYSTMYTSDITYAKCCGILFSFGLLARMLACVYMMYTNRDQQR